MSVAPDFMLQSAPDLRLKAPAAKAPATTPQPSRDDTSSFADVYAKERQVKAPERRDNTSKAHNERAEKPRNTESKGTEAASKEPAVAESGKALPGDEVEDKGDAEEVTSSEETAIDPLLLMALNGQAVPVEETAVSLTDESSIDEMLSGLPAVAPGNLTAAPLTEASHDPEIDMLNSLPGVRMAMQIGVQDQAQQKGAADAAASTDLKGEGFAEALTAFAGETVTTEDGKSEKLEIADLLNGIDSESAGKTELQTDARADAFASKLNALSQAISQQTTATQRVPLVPGQPVAMQQGGWNEAVVDRVMWLSSQNLKSAEIQLDPAELGRMEVRIQMHQDQTQVTFVSANPNVRDQLEGQMHRLRDMFTAQGMGQVDVNVADQSMARSSQGGDDSRRQGGRGGSSQDSGEELIGGVSEIRSGGAAAPRGLVDYYA